MKNLQRLIVTLSILFITQFAQAQDAPILTFDQVKGEFLQKKVTVNEGNYIFKVSNQNVGHNVGFVLVKKGKDLSKPENHIKTAYVKNPVKNNTSEVSGITKLTKGEYVYFCPLNPTSTDNILIVE